MNFRREHWNRRLSQILNLPNNAKITYYQNPDMFKYVKYERINPNHIISLVGRRKKKYSKSKPIHEIRIGKIIIPLILIEILTIPYIEFAFNFIIALAMTYFLFYGSIIGIIPAIKDLIGGKWYVNWNTRRIRNGENDTISTLSP